MKTINLGSLNIDHVYAVNHFVRPGETLDSHSYALFAGGKGFNQSIALARAGVTVRHAGKTGTDGEWLQKQLQTDGVDITHVETCDTPTGHAVIQVTPSGENAIILHGGANRSIDTDFIRRALSDCAAGDCLLLQNEISDMAEAIRLGHKARLRIAFNPAPMTEGVHSYPLELVDLFILNETEAEELTGQADPEAIRRAMLKKFPDSATVLTLGHRGAIFFNADTLLQQESLKVHAVDTTAAGDTFIGYFLAEWLQHGDPVAALKLGCRAAALCVTRPGAAKFIPHTNEL
jgi:ribokinase